MRWRQKPETRSAEPSPFEMRVHLGEETPETDVRALKTGDMGFLHSSPPDRPSTGRAFASSPGPPDVPPQILSQSRHLDLAQRHTGDADQRSGKSANMPTASRMHGGLPRSVNDDADFCCATAAAARAMGVHPRSRPTASMATAFRRGAAGNRSRHPRHQGTSPDQHVRVTGLEIRTLNSAPASRR